MSSLLARITSKNTHTNRCSQTIRSESITTSNLVRTEYQQQYNNISEELAAVRARKNATTGRYQSSKAVILLFETMRISAWKACSSREIVVLLENCSSKDSKVLFAIQQQYQQCTRLSTRKALVKAFNKSSCERPKALQPTNSLSRSNSSKTSNKIRQVFIVIKYEIQIYSTRGKPLEYKYQATKRMIILLKFALLY